MSDSVYIRPESLETALRGRADFQSLDISIVKDRQAADLIISLNRPLFTFDFTYSVTHRQSHKLVVSGKVTAFDGASAMKVLDSSARIDLLITDVGLPGGMNGRQIADVARRTRPELKVLFITGYAENAVIGNGHLAPGMEVVTKPFEIAALGQKVRDMLER